MPSRYFFRHIWDLIATRPWGNVCVLLICALAVLQLALTVYLLESAHHARLFPISAQSMMAYLNGKTTEGEQAKISQAIAGIDGVAAVIFIPRAQGLERLKKWLGQENPLVVDLQAEVLPDAFEVKLKDSDLSQAEPVAQRIRAIARVDDVRYNRGLVAHIASIYPGLRLAGFLIAVLAAAVFGILIFQTSRMALLAHSQELEVLGLLGADKPFLYAPYLAFSVLIAMLSTALGCLIAYVSVSYLRNQLPLLNDFLGPFTVQQAFTVFGFTVCCALAGSLTACRR